MSGEDQIGCDRQNQRLEDKLPSPAQEHAAPKLEQPGAASCFQAADDVTRDSGQLLSPAATPHPHNKRIDSSDFLHKSIEAAKVKTISEYQCVISMLRKKIDHASMLMSDYWEGEFDGPDNPDGALWWSPENITDYLALKYDIDGRNSQASLRQQRAIFDIAGDNSGQVLVLTPFQKRLETLPRPEARSMSASWVVHSVPDVARSEDSGGLSLFETILGTLKTSGMVRGMWKNMVAPEAVYKVV